MRMPMEGFQQYPNLSSLRLVKLEGLGKDQGVRIGASGPSNLAIESIKMPPLLPSFDQQTKRFGGAHVCLVWSKYGQQDLCKKSKIKNREEQPQNQKGSLLTSHPSSIWTPHHSTSTWLVTWQNTNQWGDYSII